MIVIVLPNGSSQLDLIRKSARRLANKYEGNHTNIEVVCSYKNVENLYVSNICLFNNGALLACGAGVNRDERLAFETAMQTLTLGNVVD